MGRLGGITLHTDLPRKTGRNVVSAASVSIDEDGRRTVFFELNGQPREVQVLDRTLAKEDGRRARAELGNPLHVAAPMPGAVVGVAVSAGEEVAAGQKLLTLEAMKMETTLYAERAGKVAEVLARPHTQVEAGDLLVRFEK